MQNLKDRTKQAVAANPIRCHANMPRTVDIVRLTEEGQMVGQMIRIGWEDKQGFYAPRKGKVLKTSTWEVDGVKRVWFFVQIVGRSMPMWIYEDCFAGFESMFMGIA